MDNLTHTLTGLMLSRAGLNRLHPRASLILMIAANIPDCDLITVIGGAASYFQFHRGISHALIALPVMAILPPLIARVFTRKQPFPWLSAWLISLVGVASHSLLDYTNAYGIRLWLPFNDAWPMLSINNIMDVWIWTILIVATLAPMLGSLVGSEIGEKRNRFPGRTWAILALSLIVLYNTGRWFAHQEAIRVQSARIYNGESPRRVFAYPDKMNPLVWQGIVETGGTYASHTVDLRRSFEPESRVVYKPDVTPAIEAAAKLPEFRTLTGFAKTILWRSTPAPGSPEGSTRVTATDLYFGFTAEAVVDRNLQVLESRFHF